MEPGLNTFMVRLMWHISAFAIPWGAYKLGVMFAELYLKRYGERARNFGFLAGALSLVLFFLMTAEIHGRFEWP